MQLQKVFLDKYQEFTLHLVPKELYNRKYLKQELDPRSAKKITFGNNFVTENMQLS